MKSPLKTLSKIQKFAIDEERKKLVALQGQEDELVRKLDRLNAEFRREKEFAKTHEDYNFAAYLERYLQTRDKLESQLAEVRAKIEEVRDVITALFKEQKTYDIVDENRSRQAEAEENAKDRQQLDEIGTNAFIKKNKK